MTKRDNTVNIKPVGVLCVVLLFAIIIGKLIYVSAAKKVDGVDIKTFAANRNSTTIKRTASRGEILSCNGETLAKDVNSYTVVAFLSPTRTTNPKYPHHVVDKENTAKVLSEYINMSESTILNLLNMKGAYQVELGPGGRNISEKLKQEIASLNLPGIGFMASTKRYYPFGDFASYIIGYAKKNDKGEIVGELGVESYYNKELTGTNGYTTFVQDAYGYQIADTPVVTVEAESGHDIYLTIDSNVQMYLENSLEEFTKKNKYEWATVTVANAKTGAILGSASTPSYNPNILNITEWNAPLVSYAYEPGSTMKIFSFMSAIEDGIYNGDEKYYSGAKQIGKNVISDWNRVGWGNITYDAGFTYSSNVAAANLGLTLGREKLVEYYKKFGFGSKTGIEMANEYSGVLNPVYDIEVANVAFGQGLTTTPIQNVQALTSLANKGTVLKPYIVEKIVNHDTNEVIYKRDVIELGKAVSEDTVNKMLELLYLTVNSNDRVATGRVYKTNSTTLIGKTGTAQIASSKGGYQTGAYNNIRSFAGLFPYEDPQFIIYISVKKLQGSSSAIAASVKSIVESIAKYKNLDQLVVKEDDTKLIKLKNYINRYTEESLKELTDLGLNVIIIGDGERVIDQSSYKDSTILKGNKIMLLTNYNKITMPDFSGWTSNDVNVFCTMADLVCNLDGYGQVVSQSIEVGEPLNMTSIIDFKLSRE